MKPNGDIIETPQRTAAALPAPTDLAPAAPSSDAISALTNGDAVPAADDEEGSAAGLPPIPSADQSTVAAEEPVASAEVPPETAEAPQTPPVIEGAVAEAPAAEVPAAEPPVADARAAEALLPPAPEAKPKPVKSIRVADGAPLDLAATAAPPAPAPAPAQREVATASLDRRP